MDVLYGRFLTYSLSFLSQAKYEGLKIMDCDTGLYGLQDFVINSIE